MEINYFYYLFFLFFYLMLSGAGDSTFLNCVEWLSLSRGAAGSWTLDRVRRIVSQGGFNYIRYLSRMRISAHFPTCWLLSFSTSCMPFPLNLIFFVYFFGGLECVGHSFAYVAHFVFLRDV
jgi:hypothetical protein